MTENVRILAEVSKATAVNMAGVVQATVSGRIAPRDAARVGLVGMAVAANVAASLNAERLILEQSALPPAAE